MQYALLGPIAVSGDDGPLEINGTLRRTLLAALLLRPNQVVSADQLADLLWGDRPSVSATTSLYNQVMRLRQALGRHAGRIRAVPPGYVIDVEPGELDTAVFAEHGAAAAQATQSADWAAASREYAAALALWRGQPLADVPALQSDATIQQLNEERLLAQQGRIEADLHLARHDQVIGELRTLIDRHPWREAFHGQLMLALYRAGRQPEALDVYRDLRRAVADEFGVEPSDSVRGLHARILRSDQGLALPPAAQAEAAAAASAAVEISVPLPPRAPVRQLPADTRAFTGRESELETLVEAARQARSAHAHDDASTVVICAINGMGGIGKTTLAIRAAHRLAECFPDGQLFIDLQGHSVDLDPVSPQDALDYLLRSLGVEPVAIPQEMQERAAFYRSRLAGTKTLLVLDNARSAAQVRPLIPAGPGCLVVVTSRTQLTGLDDAEFLSLDALPPDEAVALLSSAAGPGRVDERDPAAAELTEFCGRLPLAIRIIGARLRHRPKLCAETLLAALHSDSDPLALLKDGDRDITRVFASSLGVLPESERRLFARLGVIPGPDFDVYAAAALEEIDLGEAERRLESLLDHSLLIQHKEGRFRLHDLLRTYARVQAAECEAEQNEAARNRLLSYYLETAASARALWFGRPGGPRPLPRHVAGSEDMADAKAWFDAERENLLAIFVQDTLEAKQKLKLVADLIPYLRASGPWDQAIVLLVEAVDVARALHDLGEEARALRLLGHIYAERGMISDALPCLERAVALSRESGDRLGEAHALKTLGWAFGGRETRRALSYAQQAAQVLRGFGPTDEADAINLLAVLSNQNGRFEESVALAEQLRDLARAINSRLYEANALFHLSHAKYALEEFDEVEPILLRAREISQESRRGAAGIEQELGRLRMRRGRFAEAVEYLERAATVFVELGYAIGMAYSYGELGRIRLRLGDPDGAMALLQYALRVSLDGGLKYGESFVRTNVGYAHIARGEFAAAEDQLRMSLETGARGGFMFPQVEARVGLCALVCARDGAATALPYYDEALEFVRWARHPSEMATALVGLGRCELETGRHDSGVAHLNEAIGLYQRMGSELDMAETRAVLTSLTSVAR
ncbi:AfsR/SARP family transcriptional regulator [Actinospica robiniae]|uniref:AfsR/SARP family transcriptional regulator n=1 Tax=Actinospica robiniae TaxID=304901 RepID=UPI0003FB1E50|nr:BTAD domain-containing putative transcriptional regulator [Actinospica robiniae]